LRSAMERKRGGERNGETGAVDEIRKKKKKKKKRQLFFQLEPEGGGRGKTDPGRRTSTWPPAELQKGGKTDSRALKSTLGRRGGKRLANTEWS